MNELWCRVRAMTGAKIDARYEDCRAGDVRDSLASLEKAEQLLGYAPKVGFGEGLERTVEFFSTMQHIG